MAEVIDSSKERRVRPFGQKTTAGFVVGLAAGFGAAWFWPDSNQPESVDRQELFYCVLPDGRPVWVDTTDYESPLQLAEFLSQDDEAAELELLFGAMTDFNNKFDRRYTLTDEKEVVTDTGESMSEMEEDYFLQLVAQQSMAEEA